MLQLGPLTPLSAVTNSNRFFTFKTSNSFLTMVVYRKTRVLLVGFLLICQKYPPLYIGRENSPAKIFAPSCIICGKLQVSQSREQISTASVAIIQVPTYLAGNYTGSYLYIQNLNSLPSISFDPATLRIHPPDGSQFQSLLQH